MTKYAISRGIFLIVSVSLAWACEPDQVLTPPEGPVASEDPASSLTQPEHLNLNEEFRELARSVPGFAGFVFDGNTLQIALTESADSRAAETAVRAVVLDHDAAARVAGHFARLSIPTEAYAVEVVPSLEFQSSLSDYFSDVEGGLKIQKDGGNLGRCSLSFSARMSFTGSEHFVVASHCTNVLGATDGTRIHQPSLASGLYYMGDETFDPPFSSSLSGCPSGYECRYSDSALGDYYRGYLFGRIARTTGQGSTVIDPNKPHFIIDSQALHPYGGEAVHKVGYATGWTSGFITQTCVDTNPQDNLVFLCQDYADYESATGDSGGPVFFPTSMARCSSWVFTARPPTTVSSRLSVR